MSDNEVPAMTVEEEKEIAEASPSLESSSESMIRGPPKQAEIPTWQLVSLCVSLCFGLFLSLLDTSIVATALYTIGLEFNSLTSVTWVALAYTLTYLGCCVIFAFIGDVIGRRNAYLAAFMIFFAFSIGCGFAQSLNQLIAFRALQGVGGSGLYALTIVIFPDISPPRMLGLIGSIIGMVIAISGVLGPVLGGVITHNTTWRWVFWINAPIGIIPAIVFYLVWPKPEQMRPHQRRSFRELDFVGCILLIAASVLFVFAFQEGGIRTNAWGTALVIAPLVIGSVCWIFLFGWEFTVEKMREQDIAAIFPFRFLRFRVYMAGVTATLLSGFPYFLVIYSLPLRFQVVNEKSPLLAGIGLLPLLGASAVGSALGGVLNGKKNNTFYTFTAGSCILLLGSGLLSTLDPTQRVQAKTYGYQAFVGFGFGITVSTVSLMSGLEVSIRDSAVAQGIVAQVRVLGGSIGIAASTAILGTHERDSLLGPRILSSGQLQSLQSSGTSLSPAQRQAVRQTYSDSFNESLRVCAIISGVAVLATLFTWRRNPPTIAERRKAQLEEEISRQMAVGRAMAEKAERSRVEEP